jgi:glycosyltransferase involved in cell wall biosynthesis
MIFIFYVLIATVSIQFLYYVGVFRKTAFYKPTQLTSNQPPISVVVCAKNEADNIKKLIPLLLEQEYPEYQIVLIDDASSDDTLEIFEEFEQKSNQIKLVKVVNNEAFWANKKYALTLGIKAASYQHLLFIDSNAFPKNKNWIAHMAASFYDEKQIVIGHGSYAKNNTLLNKLIRFDASITSMQYLSWAMFGKPYMGLNRNLAYTTKTFYDVDGFINHMKIRSGGDILFINQAANQSNTVVNVSIESFTHLNPKTTFKDWLDQKRRRLETLKNIKFLDALQITVFYISQLLFIISAIVLFANQFLLECVLSVVVFRYLFSWIIVGLTAKNLDEKDLIGIYPFLEILNIIIKIQVFVMNIFSKPINWK